LDVKWTFFEILNKSFGNSPPKLGAMSPPMLYYAVRHKKETETQKANKISQKTQNQAHKT